MKSSVKAGIVQFDVRLGDPDSNLEKALSGIRELAKRGAELAVLPELWPSGFDNKRIVWHASKSHRIIDAVASEAARNGIVVAGSLAEDTGGGVVNNLVVIDSDGSVAGRYAKVHLFSPTGEHMCFVKGDTWCVCETAVGRLGLVICYDLRFPELCRVLALNGAEIMVVCAQWPAQRIAQWETLAKARAIENQVFLVAANRCGSDPDIAYGGRSLIVSPVGEILARGEDEAPCLIEAVLQKESMESFRAQIPCLREREESVYFKDSKDKQNGSQGDRG